MYVKDSKVDLTQNNLLLFEEKRKIMSYNYRQLDDFQLSGVSGGKRNLIVLLHLLLASRLVLDQERLLA